MDEWLSFEGKNPTRFSDELGQRQGVRADVGACLDNDVTESDKIRKQASFAGVTTRRSGRWLGQSRCPRGDTPSGRRASG